MQSKKNFVWALRLFTTNMIPLAMLCTIAWHWDTFEEQDRRLNSLEEKTKIAADLQHKDASYFHQQLGKLFDMQVEDGRNIRDISNQQFDDAGYFQQQIRYLFEQGIRTASK